MKFWINAFIPRRVPGYTFTSRLDPKKTAIPHPVSSSWEYLTDQRGFDNYIHAKSRMHSEFTIDFTKTPVGFTQWHKCYCTTEVDRSTGRKTCQERGDTDRMKFVLRGGRAPFVVEMDCAASNPCSLSSRFFGDIDYEGTIRVDSAARTLEAQICVDDFPAFEAYATINHGAGFKVFHAPPPRGNTVGDLPGNPDRPFHFTVEDADGDGVFEVRKRHVGTGC